MPESSSQRFRTIRIGDCTVKLQIWDTAGQERFRTITSAYYRGADGIIMVYDVSKLESFEHIQDWLSEVNKYSPDNSCKLLIGNKNDRTDKVVSTEKAQEYANTMQEDPKNEGSFLPVPFLETSAKTAKNVDEAFTKMAEALIRLRKKEGDDGKAESKTKMILADEKGTSRRKPNCCK